MNHSLLNSFILLLLGLTLSLPSYTYSYSCTPSEEDLRNLEEIEETLSCSEMNMQGICATTAVVAGGVLTKKAKKVDLKVRAQNKRKLKASNNTLKQIEEALDKEQADRRERQKNNIAKREKLNFAINNHEKLIDPQKRINLRKEITRIHNALPDGHLDKDFVKTGHLPTKFKLELLDDYIFSKEAKRIGRTPEVKLTGTSLLELKMEDGKKTNPFTGNDYYSRVRGRDIHISSSTIKELKAYRKQLIDESKLLKPYKNFEKMKRQILTEIKNNPQNLSGSKLAQKFKLSPDLATRIDSAIKVEKKVLRGIKTRGVKTASVVKGNVSKLVGRALLGYPALVMSVSRAGCAGVRDNQRANTSGCDPKYAVESHVLEIIYGDYERKKLALCDPENRAYYQKLHKLYTSPLKINKASCRGKQSLVFNVEAAGKKTNVTIIPSQTNSSFNQLRVNKKVFKYNQDGQMVNDCTYVPREGDLCTFVEDKGVETASTDIEYLVERKLRSIGPIINSCCTADEMPSECREIGFNQSPDTPKSNSLAR